MISFDNLNGNVQLKLTLNIQFFKGNTSHRF